MENVREMLKYTAYARADWFSCNQKTKLIEIFDLYSNNRSICVDEIISQIDTFLKEMLSNKSRIIIYSEDLSRYLKKVDFKDESIAKHLKHFVVNYHKKNYQVDLSRVIDNMNKIIEDTKKKNDSTVLLKPYMTKEWLGETDYDKIANKFNKELADYMIFDIKIPDDKLLETLLIMKKKIKSYDFTTIFFYTFEEKNTTRVLNYVFK